MKPRIVAFLGRAGSGKTTAAEHLVKNYGAVRISFAHAVKELAKRLWDFTDEQVYGAQEAKETVDERYGITPREALQRLGQGAREVIDPLVWITAVVTKIEQEFSADPTKRLWVIDDMRYVNETETMAQSRDAIVHIIKLTCPDAPATPNPNHPSEAEVDQVHPRFISHAIISKRSPESVDLLSKIDAAMQALFPDEPTRGVFPVHGIQLGQ